jgi:hypothetical protein
MCIRVYGYIAGILGKSRKETRKKEQAKFRFALSFEFLGVSV